MKMNKYIFITTCIILLSACTSQVGQQGNGSINCERVEKHCRFTGYYDEWYTNNGELACTCVRLQLIVCFKYDRAELHGIQISPLILQAEMAATMN